MTPIDTTALSTLCNLVSGFSNWHQRTYSRPEPYGSQAGEDAILAELLPESNGVYVDVGAGEPISCSNTFQLWNRGWRGLLIEPRKDAVWDLCSRRYGDYVYPAAASNIDGYGQLHLHGSVSSLQADWNIAEQALTFCPTERLSSILAKFPSIRDACLLCSIDVEGHEREVLEGIDWVTFRPRVFCIEYIIYGVSPPNNENTERWEPLLLAQGYKLHQTTALNKIYVRA